MSTKAVTSKTTTGVSGVHVGRILGTGEGGWRRLRRDNDINDDKEGGGLHPTL